MAQLIVEIHIPLTATGMPRGSTWPRSSAIIPADYEYPWIFEVEECLAEREEQGRFQLYDDGEQLGQAYLFFITGAGEEDLLAIAADVAALPGVPKGVVAVVTDGQADEMGVGRRVPIG